MTRLSDLADKSVAVLGYGREGRAALRALIDMPRQPAAITVYTQGEATPETALPPYCTTRTAPATAQQLLAHDCVIKSPGISPYRSPVSDALAAGVRFVSGSHLWMTDRPAGLVVGITGSKGKSTTAALTRHLLSAAGRRVVLAGNIGQPLLSITDRDADAYVIELSSYQTWDLDAALDIAVALNLHPEHLDWHGDVETYYRDKLRIFQHPAPVCLVNGDDGELLARTRGLARRRRFNDKGGFRARGLELLHEGRSVAQGPWPGIVAPHLMEGVCAAMTIAETMGLDVDACAAALGDYPGLPHRLRLLGTRQGRLFVDDSLASNPVATLAAAAAFPGRPTTLLVGGLDRGLDWRPFVDALAVSPPHALIGMGRLGARVVAMLAERDVAAGLATARDMDDAIVQALALTPTQGVIVLSPGAPSQDVYRDYAERGADFARAAGFAPPEG